MRLTTQCPIDSCGKNLVLTNESKLSDGIRIKFYKCGHFLYDLPVEKKPLVLWNITQTKSARKYQADSVEFIVNGSEENPGGFNCVIGHQMRLGKTPIAEMALKSAYEEKTPCLLLVRGANLWQWIREHLDWVDDAKNSIWPIIGSKSFIPPGFKSYIMSMDTFSREGMVEQLLTFGFKLVIVDEAHSFKNDSSKRSQALIQFLHEISKATITHIFPFTCMMCSHTWDVEVIENVNKQGKHITKTEYCPECNAWNQHTAQKEKIHVERNCGVILLSGTSIINSADEYFIPLNIVAPEKFPSRTNFRRSWLMQDSKGKWSRINPYRMDSFKELIKPYVLRYEKEDVYTDIPARNRMFTVIKITDERLKKAYNAVLDQIESNINSGNLSWFSNIGELQQLRQICGLAKVDFVADMVEMALEEDPTKKIAIGVHHHSVRDALLFKLDKFGVCKLDGDDDDRQKDFIAHRHFETSKERVLLLGMMAAREGLELVYLENALVLERQWASAYEEQFEYRFYNPDKDYLEKRGLGRDKITNIEYVIAQGTIDEFFYDLVESKRRIFGETLSNHFNIETDAESFKELLNRTVAGRL